MLLRNISSPDLVIHSQTKSNLHYKVTCILLTNLSTVKKSARICPLEESLDKISLFSDFFDSKWNSPALEKNFP